MGIQILYPSQNIQDKMCSVFVPMINATKSSSNQLWLDQATPVQIFRRILFEDDAAVANIPDSRGDVPPFDADLKTRGAKLRYVA